MSQPWPQAEATWGRGCAGVREWASWRHWCCRLSPARGPAWRQVGSSESRAGPCGGAKAGVLVAAPFPSPLPAFQGGSEGRLGARAQSPEPGGLRCSFCVRVGGGGPCEGPVDVCEVLRAAPGRAWALRARRTFASGLGQASDSCEPRFPPISSACPYLPASRLPGR